MAASRKSYYRSYIILKEEMKGYASEEREPSGNCKVEVRGDKGKAHIYAQGLKQLPEESMYKIYFITSQMGKSIGVYAAPIEIDSHGKGESKWEFDPDHVGGTGYKIEEFDIIAILVKQQGVPDHALLCPLVGYKDKECSWKNGYEELQRQEMDATAVEEEAKEETGKNIELATKEEKKIEKIQEEKVSEITEETIVTENDVETRVEEKDEGWYSQPDNAKYNEYNDEEAYEQYKKEMNLDFENEEWGQWGYPESFDKIDEECADSEEADMIKEMFDTYPAMNPFENPMKGWAWIRISVRDLTALPVSIWRMMNNPFVLVAYKRYRHLLLGRNNTKLILGIPNIYHPREKNIAYIHGFSKFLCCQNGKPKAGEYGYWIIEMDE